MGPTGPARRAVDRHRARAAHPDAAGIAVRERRVELALDVRDDVKDCLARITRHFEGLEGALRLAAPDRDLHALSYNRVRTNSRWPSASAAVSRPLAVRNMHSSNLSPA